MTNDLEKVQRYASLCRMDPFKMNEGELKELNDLARDFILDYILIVLDKHLGK